MKPSRLVGNMFIAAGTPLHDAVQHFLFKTAGGSIVPREDIREAERQARQARGALLAELEERIGRDVKVWFEILPPDDLPAWRVSMCVSDQLLQYAVFGEPAVFRRLVDDLVGKICEKVRSVTKERDGCES